MTSWGSPADGAGASVVSGTMLGDRYELTGPLASGGMAQVWSARDLVLDRTVAAKILHPHLATDQAFVERFRREAVAAARLSHSSIVAIYDTISSGSVEAIVMELIDGRTLRQELDDVGALPATEVARIGADIADALDEAHRAGIVHRDIKPANIMIATDGRVLVTDFGIAKAGTDADLTVTGTLLGTAKYLAPEQVTGDQVDPRADLYSLGVVLFEALTGTVPFKANTDAATALARLHQEPPPVGQLRPNIPPELEAVVTTLMARDPNHRYPRASLAREALRAAVSGAGQPAPGGGVPDGTAASRFAPRPVPPSTGATSGGGLPPVVASPSPPPASLTPPPRSPAAGGGLGVAPGDVVNPSRSTQWPSPAHPPSGGFPNQGSPVEVLPTDPTPGEGAERVVRTRRSRIFPVLGVVVLIAAVLGGWSILTDTSLDEMLGSVMGDDEPVPLTFVSIHSFDPQTPDKEKEENEELAALAADGDLTTAWTTETYKRRQLAGLKEGVGLLLELSETRPLSEIVLDTNSEDWTAEVYVSDGFSADGTDWGEPAASIIAGPNRVVRPLNGAEGGVVLLWIRDTGVTDEAIQFELAEVEVR